MNEQINQAAILDENGTELFDGTEKIDVDRELKVVESTKNEIAKPTFRKWHNFPLRGMHENKIIDISAPLLALCLRVINLKQHHNIEELHKKIRIEIESIELELHRLGYDRVTILAHRYCLCSMIDETIMSSAWGQDSSWSERSLLITFHHETWGGEKFFVVLDRLLSEPSRYIDLIEFLYYCLCLGFQGKYRVVHNGQSQLNDVISEVHEIIRNERGDAPETLLRTKENFIEKKHFISRQTSISVIALITLLIMGIIYGCYYFITDNYGNKIVNDIQNIVGSELLNIDEGNLNEQ